jgi:YD repeat-containing protein
MRDPDSSGWAYWESVVPTNGRENVRRAFEEAPEFAGILASIVPNGSATANAASLISARVEPRNQPGHGMLARDVAWSVPLVSLPGRNGLDLGLVLSYSSQVWTRSGPYIHFDEDNGFPSPGFRLGFPVIQRQVFDAQTARNAFLMIAPSGQRVELRQVGSSNTYEAADSSYLQLIDNSPNLLLRTADGTQLSFIEIQNEFRCWQVKDRNGNFLSIASNPFGRITSITDTLGRVINFNYDSNANLISITQSWNGQPSHQWVSFGWSTRTMQSSFSGVAVVGTVNGSIVPVITQVSLNDTSYFTFDYNNSLQVTSIRNYFGTTERNATTFTYETPASDVPRLLDTRVSAQNWTGINGVPAQVITQYSVAADGACVMTAPDGTIYKEYYGTGWQRGLTTQSEVWSGSVRQKWTTTAWTQDNTLVSYEMNPRVVETNIYDASGNRRRTTIDYGQFGLPNSVKEYAADGVTEIRQTITDYNLSQAYLDRRIIGLLSQVQLKNASSFESKISYEYDDPSRLQSLPAAAVQHDGTYNTSFTARGNVTAVSRWDVSDINNAAKKLTSYTNYYATGTPGSSTDPAGHQTSFSYADSFSDSVNRNTFAYPTTMTDADGFSSYVQYNFDIGATTRTQSPAPAGQSQGAIQTMSYNNLGQLERVTSANNGAYKRFWYGPNFNASYASVNNLADELYSVAVRDGLGRVVGSAGNHAGSLGGYSMVNTIYDQMGRAVKVSNPTEIYESWAPGGDDGAGIYYTQQTYDWNGRPLVTTNPDGTTKEVGYSGCGCAGGAVVTMTDEGTIDGGVAKRRQEKIYSDVLGRAVKTETLNWQGGTVYSTSVNTYNARDQITQVRQYAGVEGSSSYQDTTMTYDGYGRLRTKHLPEENAGTNTTWTYNADDSVNTVTDARGAVTTLGYAGTNRGLVKSVTHTLSGSPTINVSYNYDAVGDRISMNDGLGTLSYSYDQLSRMTSETRTLNGIGSFTLNYTYNLAGQLASFTSFGNSVSYTRDATGRLTAVSGSPFGGVTQYVNNIKYRAWGGRRELTYGNNHTGTTQYNSRLLPTTYSLTNAMTRNYSYFADGRLKSSSLLEDGNSNRFYEYDHAARLRSDSTPTTFAQNLTYDVWGNATQSNGWHWSQFIFSNGTYTNNRNSNWQYNAAGQVTNNQDNVFQYDAAGRTKHIWTQGGVIDSGEIIYDGDGQVVRSSGSAPYTLRSTVLGGRVVAELLNNGGRSRGFVYAEGEELLAIQYEGTNHVVWEHHDPAEQSVRLAEGSGVVVDEREETATGAKIEKEDPYPTNPGFTGADTDGVYPYLGTVGKGVTGCTMAGILIPDCSWLLRSVNRFEQVEADARAEFLGYSVEMFEGPTKNFGNDRRGAEDEARRQGHNTIIRNWRVNDNWFQTPILANALIQAQNPQTTQVLKVDPAEIRSGLERMLRSGGCGKFVEDLINRLAADTKNPFVSDYALDLFDAVAGAKKGGFVRGGLADKNHVSSIASGHLRSGDASIHLNSHFDFGSSDPEVQAKAVIALDAFNTLHELIHHAGLKGHYNDQQISQTLSNWLGIPGLPVKRKGESERDFIGRNSTYFSQVLSSKCPTLSSSR